jgi:hypothetical protein
MENKRKCKHPNYPKQRKVRVVKSSWTYQVLDKIGEEKLFEIWKDRGHYDTARIVSEIMGFYVSNMCIQYIAQRKFSWKRIISDKSCSLYKGVLNGVDPSIYKTIIFA